MLPAPDSFRVLIIGAGMSGLCAAVRLRQAGVAFTLLEKNSTVGGTWYENRYPGCGVDTPNHFYSYSFAPHHDWSMLFAKRQELWEYFERVADNYGIREYVRFNTEVESAIFDEAGHTWTVNARHSDGSRSALVGRCGDFLRRRTQSAEDPRDPGFERVPRSGISYGAMGRGFRLARQKGRHGRHPAPPAIRWDRRSRRT